MKRFLQLILGGVIAVVILGGLLAAVASVIIGRWLTPSNLEEQIESELACQASIGSVERQLFGIGKPARVMIKNLEIKAPKGALEKLRGMGEMDEEQEAMVSMLLEEPVVIVDEVVLELNRKDLLERKIDIGMVFLQNPIVRIVDVDGLGNSLSLLAKDKPKPLDPDAPKVPKEDKKEVEAFAISLQSFTIEGAQIEYTEVSSKPKEQDDLMSYALMGMSFSVSEVDLVEGAALTVPFKMTGLLAIDQGGGALRLVSAELDGGGQIAWEAGMERSLDTAQWNLSMELGPNSFVWGGDLIDDFKDDLEPFAKFGILDNDWELDPRGTFPKGQRLEIAGDGVVAALSQPLRANFEEAWVEADTTSKIFLEGDFEHVISGRIHPPDALADGAYTKIPKQLDRVNIGGLTDGAWDNIREAYFVGKDLQLPLISEGPIDDFDLEVTPDPLDLVDGVRGIVDIVEQGGDFLSDLFGGGKKEDKKKEKDEDKN